MWSNILAVLASGFGIWAVFKYVILIEMRIDSNTFKTLYDLCKDDPKIMLAEEFISEARYPVTYSAICFFKGSPWFYINHNERLMQAGWQSKDHITFICCFRWSYNKMKKYLSSQLKSMQLCTLGVPVELMLPYGTDKIGSLKEITPEPVVADSLWRDFENEVAKVSQGELSKTSALLYGPPGNGKTSLIRYLATKYRMPIMIFTLNPEWNNHDLLLVFAQIPKRCIVLMEDFDNYFNNRTCIIGGGENKYIKFTYDIILNALDGVYTTYQNVVFIMTVNDIEKVDPALKNRPSRFKFTRCFNNPDSEIRSKLLPEAWVSSSEGLNLDQIFRLKESYDQGLNFATAIEMLEKQISEDDVRKKAHEIYETRTKENIPGDDLTDWERAKNAFKNF